ncbi:MAG: type IV pilin protein [Succinivibrionaceae bacterium]|nr:type IV pilin protein [Succinivibrionaceae bacterium]
MINKVGLKKGFSLIEIMVVIVIISILTSIAAVSYRAYIVKARRTAAQEDLMQFQQRMEEYFSLNHTYGTGGKCAEVFPKNGPESGAYYELTCDLVSGYRLVATAQGTQKTSDGECTVMYLYRNGTRGGGKAVSSGSDNACW